MDECGIWSWYEKKPEQMGSRYYITPAGSISGQIPDEHAPNTPEQNLARTHN